MNDWTPIIVMLLATLGVVAIVRRLIRVEDKIDMLIAAVTAAAVEYRERQNEHRP